MALLREAFKTLLRFVDLSDVPPYTGAALSLLRVNATNNAIEYVVPGNAYQLDHGTAAGNLVRLDSNARLPAINIPNLPGSIINSGVIAPAHLGTGTANANTVLYGDGVFREPGVGGTVTSVGLSLPSIFTVSNSPITTSGTLTATLANQTANTVFASSGGAPTFRSLEVGDIPNLPGSQITTGIVAPGRLGTGIASANTVLHGDGVWRGTSIEVQDDSISLTNAVSSINFTGAGVTASNTGNAVTVSIPGGGGGSSSNVVEVITVTSTLSRRLDATYLVNTSGGAITITLPSNPENNDIVEVGDYGNTFSSFPLSILPNAGQLLLGGTTALLLDRNRQAIRLIFNGGRWSALTTYVLSNDLLSEMQAIIASTI